MGGGLRNFKIKETGYVVLNLQALLPEIYIYFSLLHQFLGECIGASCWPYSCDELCVTGEAEKHPSLCTPEL
jgi:hypothetical protein